MSPTGVLTLVAYSRPGFLPNVTGFSEVIWNERDFAVASFFGGGPLATLFPAPAGGGIGCPSNAFTATSLGGALSAGYSSSNFQSPGVGPSTVQIALNTSSDMPFFR